MLSQDDKKTETKAETPTESKAPESAIPEDETKKLEVSIQSYLFT